MHRRLRTVQEQLRVHDQPLRTTCEAAGLGGSGPIEAGLPDCSRSGCRNADCTVEAEPLVQWGNGSMTMDDKRHSDHGGPAGKGPPQPAREQAAAIGNDSGGRGYEGDALPGEPAAGSPSGWTDRPGTQGRTTDGTVIASDCLAGTPVHGSDDALLGRVSHVLVDLAEGCIAFIVVELEEAAGGASCAIPWTALDVDPAIPRFSLAQTADDLRQAPTFDPAHWPPMADSAWLDRVHLFFDCLPYWVPPR